MTDVHWASQLRQKLKRHEWQRCIQAVELAMETRVVVVAPLNKSPLPAAEFEVRMQRDRNCSAPPSFRISLAQTSNAPSKRAAPPTLAGAAAASPTA
mmetsp:Transcript_77600/g.251097  ORF Transcript_77600/g.251097 Transcript_77600/m.251097 type:complete len:97 (+) Transcript_77600:122-412(+)